MYTKEDLERARAELKDWQDRFNRYSGNNPEKYQSDIRTARRKVREIEEALKASGELPLSEQEKFAAMLDKAFPNARSREVVEYEGRKYQRRFYPLEKSRSGKTVTEWGKGWIDITDK